MDLRLKNLEFRSMSAFRGDHQLEELSFVRHLSHYQLERDLSFGPGGFCICLVSHLILDLYLQILR